MQNNFTDGALGTEEAQAIVPNVVARIQEAHANKKPVIFTRNRHFLYNYTTSVEGKYLPILPCIDGTYGGESCDEIEDIISE